MSRPKKPLILLIIMLLSLTPMLAPNVVGDSIWEPPVQPLQIYIQSDGTVNPSSVPIQKSENIYTLTADIFNASIIIEADNIVIDGAGFMLQGNGKISGFRGKFFEGISIINQNNVAVRNLTIKNHDFSLVVAYSSGITLAGNQAFDCLRICNSSFNCLMEENSLSRVEVQSLNNTFVKNNFTLPYSHLSLESSNNQVKENLFNGSIRIVNSQYNVISKNSLVGAGIEICGGSTYNEVYANNITSVSTGFGVLITNSIENTIHNNVVRDSQFGIYLYDLPASYGFPNATGNLLYQNTLIGNTRNAAINYYTKTSFGHNSWNNGKEGNYWSDYNGTDTDGDGIGDQPYIIDENNRDNYPLIRSVYSNNSELSSTPEPSSESLSTSYIIASVIVAAVLCLTLAFHFRRRRLPAKLI